MILGASYAASSVYHSQTYLYASSTGPTLSTYDTPTLP